MKSSFNSFANHIRTHGVKKKKKNKFYHTKTWEYLRRKIVKLFGNECMNCQKTGKVHVDHIKPKSKYPYLKYNAYNLQVLCPECNISKGDVVIKDYRTKKQIKMLDKLVKKTPKLKKLCERDSKEHFMERLKREEKKSRSE